MNLNISIIILTYNEELHIGRCIENVKSIADDIFVVDSFSDDRTVEIANNLGAKVYQNKWPGNQAQQFNWALSNLPVKTNWILRLDADEYLTSELIDELVNKLPHTPDTISGIIFKRRHIFLGKWIKTGTYPVKLLRLFRFGKGSCELRLMDEHIHITEGDVVEFQYDFIDHNLKDLNWWSTKHIGYATREAAELLNIELGVNKENRLTGQAAQKRNKKSTYAKQPLFIRSFAYFIYVYFVKLGFTEGKEGFLWYFLQGLWYRTLVDAKIYEIKKNCGNNPQKIMNYLMDNYNIDCKLILNDH